MKIPLKWLADYVPLTLSADQLIERLTLAGLEVGAVRRYGVPMPEGVRLKDEEPGPVWERDKIVTAEVLGTDKHPDADKLKLPVVAYGEGRTKQLVTGATNLHVGDRGQKVILALTGAELFDGHATPKKLGKLKPTKIRGIPSDAMVCSALELGISDEHAGIILLELDAPVGVPLADFMGDLVLDIDVLPNMARALSLLGVAREVAALTGQALRPPPRPPEGTGRPIEGLVRVEIADTKLSARYAAGLIEGVQVGPAPGWMQRRLTYAGMRPINNLVDVTNYVMLESGQPLHAFDYDVLRRRAGGKAPTISVRPARACEVLRTLDQVERKLTPTMLVIADEAGAIALAGVMGGAETEVSEETTNVLLESANFDFLNIRRTMRELNLPSEASLRFSRGVHPELVAPALSRAADLMRQHAGGTVCRGIVDDYPAPPKPQMIDLTMREVRRVLGIDLPRDECVRILRALEYKVEEVGPDALRALAPPHRLDIQEGPADLIEDLARLHGYDDLPATLLRDELPDQAGNPAHDFEEHVRDRLVCADLQEVITYALTTPEKEALLRLPDNDYVKLLNPISAERTAMRHSVLTGMLEATAANLRNTDEVRLFEVRLFEVGAIYLPRAGQKLPDEPRRLALVLCGRRRPEFWADGKAGPVPMDFFDLKGVVEALLADLHVPQVSYRPAKPLFLHPGKAAEVRAGEQSLGVLGELHPNVADAFDLGGRAVLVAELDLDALRAVTPSRHAYAPVAHVPAALQDISLVVEENVPAARVAAEIRIGGGELLRHVRLLDVYRGQPIAAGRKSLAYALIYQDPANLKTLTDKEIDRAHKRIEDRLRHVLKAQIRGKDVQ
jgi:phenylalanyl-tRNA synthetase beta chain